MTLDGPSCSGKGTLSKILAQKLGWLHIDSGLFYRIVAIYCLENRLNDMKPEMLWDLSQKLTWQIEQQQLMFYLEGRKLEDKQLRQAQTSKWASILAQQESVREFLKPLIRKIAQKAQFCIADGRDMASVVFPQARWKFFLTAEVEVRAQRRWGQLKEQGVEQSLDIVLEQLKERDKRDTTRAFDPLKVTEQSIIIDTTQLNEEQTVQKMLSYVDEHFIKNSAAKSHL